jgi:hypothetical protein
VPGAESITSGVVAIVVEKKKQRRRNMKNSITACNEFIVHFKMRRYVEVICQGVMRNIDTSMGTERPIDYPCATAGVTQPP